MATLARNVHELEILRRMHELEVETRKDKARFAAWFVAILVVVSASLIAGLIHTSWLAS